MALSEEEREAFLRRMSGVREARLEPGESKPNGKLKRQRVWTDPEIEIAIAFGF